MVDGGGRHFVVSRCDVESCLLVFYILVDYDSLATSIKRQMLFDV